MSEYNQNELQFEKNYKKLSDVHLLQKEYKYKKWGKTMLMINDKSTIDKKIFRCRGNNPKHDSKINIGKNSIYEDFQIPLFILYYLTLECFPFNKCVTKYLIEIEEICKKINKPSTNKAILKLFQFLRNKSKLNIVKIGIKSIWEWNLTKMGLLE